MNCPNCGTVNETNGSFCANCGASMKTDETVRIQIPVPPVPPIPQPVSMPRMPVRQEIPEEYKPMSPWAFMGWRILFMIPVVGFVLLIVMSFAPRNKSLKNFTRSYWCMILIGLITAVIAVVIAVVAGVGLNELMQNLS